MNADSTIHRIQVRATPDGRLSRRDAAKFIGVEARTLANWKSQGVGPRQVKIGGRVFYRLTDLSTFVEGGVN